MKSIDPRSFTRVGWGFGSRGRDQCLCEHWFRDIPHARRIIEAWRRDYNEIRPPIALGNLPPREFAERAA